MSKYCPSSNDFSFPPGDWFSDYGASCLMQEELKVVEKEIPITVRYIDLRVPDKSLTDR